MEARKLSDSIQKKAGNDGENLENADEIVQALDAMGYEEAAQYVYGMMYPEWKKRHVQKASDEQMEKFNGSKPIWATHDKQVLAKRREDYRIQTSPQTNATTSALVCTRNMTTKTSLLSNVCCEDIDNIDYTKTATNPVPQYSNKPQAISTFCPPELPAVSFSLRILTVSDRAFLGTYETGDLSGPAVSETVLSMLKSNPSTTLEAVEIDIVPDEMEAIQQKLLEWSSSSTSVTDVILTTGGTGFSPRDVTPEATQAILERPCQGLMAFCGMQTQSTQHLAALSRGTAGVRNNTMIANLPGNPRAVREILPVLLPLLLQAVADMKQ